MASQVSQQYAFRAQKCMGLVRGTPDYVPVEQFEQPAATSRLFGYSSDGRLFACALPDSIRICYAETSELLRELPLVNIMDFKFSPRGTYISTWERPVKLEDGAQHKNLRVFSVSTGEELASFTQKSMEGWDLQYTLSESRAIRLVSSEVQVFDPADWKRGVVDKLKVEGATTVSLSPGLNPYIAVFVAEKNGQPATIRLYSLTGLASPPTCQKSAFRAESVTFRWNALGTQVLAFIRAEVDAANKSYYGESRLYLLSAAGNYECQVPLPKEGPVHDFAWSPNSKEFGVVCGFTPTRTVIFDQRTKILHDFGTAMYNYISYNPQGRLLVLSGFGNMSGPISVFDRRTLNNVATIEAPNTTFCEWSPDGRFFLTATLSPRLRVDNGIKIWHCSGPLVHVQPQEELYQVSWRPTPVDAVAPFPQQIPPAPAPSASVSQIAATAKPASAKPAGAYRPPGARGTAAPDIYKRSDGDETPPHAHSRSPVPGAPANGQNGRHPYPNGRAERGRRHVPGAAPSPSPARGETDGDKKRARNRKGKDGKPGKDGGSGTATPALDESAPATPGIINLDNLQVPKPVDTEDAGSVPPTPGVEAGLDLAAKKIRNLTKKLKAIEELKGKAARGEHLEATQVKKMEGEAELRKELAALTPS